MSVRGVARELRERNLTIDEAITRLSGLEGTTVVRDAPDPEEALTRLVTDSPAPGENDVLHLDVLRSSGVITPEEHARLVNALD